MKKSDPYKSVKNSHCALFQLVAGTLLWVFCVIPGEVSAQDTLEVRSRGTYVYKNLESWTHRWQLNSNKENRYLLTNGKITVKVGDSLVTRAMINGEEAMVKFPVLADIIYTVEISGKNCYPPVTYQLNTEGYDRSGKKVVGFGGKYSRKSNVDWKMNSPGYTLEAKTAQDRLEIKNADYFIPYSRDFKYNQLTKRFRPDSIGKFMKDRLNNISEFSKESVQNRKEQRKEGDLEDPELSAIRDSLNKRMDSLRSNIDDRFVNLSRIFGKKGKNEGSKSDKKAKKAMLLEDEEIAHEIDMEVRSARQESIDQDGIHYERDKIHRTRNAILEQFGEAETTEDSLQLFMLIQKLDAAEKNLDKIESELENHKVQAELQKNLAERQAENLKMARSKNQILYIGLTAISIVLAAALYFLILSRKLNKRVNEQVISLKESNEEIQTQRDKIEEQKLVVENSNREMTSSIVYAERIQRAILNKRSRIGTHLPEHFMIFKPKDIVSGDFYWAYKKKDYLYMAVADCTGHGVPGALLTMLGTSFLNEICSAQEIFSPGEMLDRLRTKIVTELSQRSGKDSNEDLEMKDGMDISLARLNQKTLEMEWSGANNPLYILRSGEIEVIRAHREPIGLTKSPTPFANHKIQLSKGDLVYLFSDGFADQFGGPKNKKFGYKRLRELMISNHQKPIPEQKETFKEALSSWMKEGKDDQIDDICLVGIKV